MSENTFPTITEDDADTSTRHIYEDIKVTMGVALVNLVWRHLAVSPPVLHWSWQVLKPHYLSGAIPSAAWSLRESLRAPAMAPLNSTERHSFDACGNKHGTSEQIAGLDAVLRTYERGNAQNLIAMCYLQACLENTVDNSIGLPALNNQQRRAEEKDRLVRKIPPLPDWSSLDPATVATINAMTTAWVPEQYRGFSPSVFRHISHWPEFLQLYHSRLQHLHTSSSGTLDSSSEQAILHSRELARQMGPVPTAVQPLSDDDQQWLQTALTLFIEGMISRGVIIVPAMRALLGSFDSPQES